uniref:Reverse transcriptase domain-containing protein n=1 Tax=Tanacetum cinerariifolium TaxID=118510 RepID=A0A6L2KJN4_TANCI|nr:reverse transcriptase domain-containing protein [Tanacetum cinerariifolium]
MISFPPMGEEDGTEGLMIIKAEIMGHFVPYMYVDGGPSSKILYEHCFNRFRPEIGDGEWINFMIVRSPSPYNGIIRRPGARRIQAVSSTTYEMLKFPVTGGTITLHSSRIISLECTMVSGLEAHQPVIDQATEEKIQPADMTGVLRHIIEDMINICEGCLPVRQKKRAQAPERNKAIYEEVEKLVNADIMKEVHYHSWLSNPIMRKRKIIYLAATKEAISAVLMMERDGKQVPIYFVRRALQGLKINYTPMEKLILALASANKRLKRYFQMKSASGSRRRRTHMDDSNPQVPHERNSPKRKEKGKSHTPQGRTLQANYVLREIDEGSCSMHACLRSVVAKALRSGYYWPTMHADAKKLIRECNSCQWIEVKPVVTITGAQIKKFVWDNIVCRFGLPGEIISDNEKQFRDNPFKDWCEKLCIHQCFSSIKHPQANGLVERAKRSLGEGIKARLDKRRKNWLEEISHVLWAHRTMIKSSNEETPLAHALEINLDLLEEKIEQAEMEKYYNARVHNTSFKLRDLVYQNNKASHTEDRGKLEPKWEGPYEVAEALGKGAYKLRDRNGNILPRTWNVCNIKKCYVHEM